MCTGDLRKPGRSLIWVSAFVLGTFAQAARIERTALDELVNQRGAQHCLDDRAVARAKAAIRYAGMLLNVGEVREAIDVLDGIDDEVEKACR